MKEIAYPGKKAKQVWEEYLKKYPEGVYSSIIRSFLKGGE